MVKTKEKVLNGKARKYRDENIMYILPLIMAVAFVPIIVFFKQLPLDDVSKQFWPTDNNSDFFSYYKSIFIMVSAAGAILLFLFKSYQQGINFKKVNIYIPVAVYSFFVILSAVLSKYPSVSANGFADRYEGAYVLLSYMVLLLATVNFLNGEKQIRIFLGLLFVSAAIIGLIGLFQFFGLDLFKSMFGKLLILPSKYHNLAETMSFQFNKYTIYSTLYNTNFVGSYMAMLFPITLISFLMVKKRLVKISLGVLTVILFMNWVGCRSRAGYVGGALALIVAIIFLRKEILKKIKLAIAVVGAFVIIFFIMNAVSDGALAGRILPQIGNNASSQSTEKGQPTQQIKPFGFEDIKLDSKKVSIIGSIETLSLVLEENQVHFLATDGSDLNFNSGEDGKMSFLDSRYEGISIIKDQKQNLFRIIVGAKQVLLFVDKNGFKIVGQKGKLIDRLENVEKFGFEGNETLGSSRGYIWSRSIPLLKHYLFVGSGPDTYAFVFPQFDVVGKLKAFDKVSEIVDKPHNMYLQIGINTGVVSLIAIIALFAMYLVSCIKLYIRCKFTNMYEVIGVAIFAAVSGYLGAAFFNDSLVSVAPVFWVLLGLGISCNYFVAKDMATVEVVNGQQNVPVTVKNAITSKKNKK